MPLEVLSRGLIRGTCAHDEFQPLPVYTGSWTVHVRGSPDHHGVDSSGHMLARQLHEAASTAAGSSRWDVCISGLG